MLVSRLRVAVHAIEVGRTGGGWCGPYPDESELPKLREDIGLAIDKLGWNFCHFYLDLVDFVV